MKTLYDQMDKQARIILACLLGFTGPDAADSAGFICNLRDIPALPAGWTYGQALRAYCESLLK